MSEWEYKVVKVNTLHEPEILEWVTGTLSDGHPALEKMLNSMGADGWELVAFLPAHPADRKVTNPVSKFESTMPANPWIYHAVFKRPPETAEERKKRIDNERLERRIKEHSSK